MSVTPRDLDVAPRCCHPDASWMYLAWMVASPEERRKPVHRAMDLRHPLQYRVTFYICPSPQTARPCK